MTAKATLPVLLGVGVHGSRPAASAVGSGGLYSCTTHNLVYQTDGSSWTTWATLGGSVSLTTQSAILTSADVTLANGGWTDILTVTLGAGTWVIFAMTTCTSSTGAQDATIRIQDTTNTATLGSASGSIGGTLFTFNIALMALVTLSGSTTVKLQGGRTNAGNAASALKALASNTTGNNATQIIAVQIG